jgi:AcrR family transcriptional regulator
MPRPRLDHVRKAQILSAAAAVLSERGYANTRVADIAASAGTSPAAILYWFDGKDGLLAEALRLREQEFHDRYTVKAAAKSTASERLRVLVEAMLYHYDWKLWMELCVLALRDKAAAAERDRLDRRWRAALRSVINEGQVSGEFESEDADDAMFVLAALLDGLAPLLPLKAKGVTRDRVERVWLAEASRLLGPGFDASPLKRTR